MRSAALPKTFAQLVRRGGPERFVREAAREAADHAAREEREFWLATLEQMVQPDDAIANVTLGLYIRDLRRRLGLRQPPDVVRAQTRERVRRFRRRQRGLPE